MARKAFVVTDATREKVRYLAGVGVPQGDIAKIVGCAPKTLRKRFRDELDRGVAEANAQISGYLFAAAKAGNIAAIIFWLKTRANWRERASPDDPIPGGSAAANSNVVLVLPDNSRDPELTQVLQEAQQKYFSRKRQRDQPPSPSHALIRKIELARLRGGPGQSTQTIGVASDDADGPPLANAGQTRSKHGA